VNEKAWTRDVQAATNKRVSRSLTKLRSLLRLDDQQSCIYSTLQRARLKILLQKNTLEFSNQY